MLEHSGGGNIINITSTMGRLAGRGFAAYATAKAALAHYTRSAALDLCPRIRVNAIAPGSILTSALDVVASNDELRQPMEKVTPMRRLGDPIDIAAAAVYLASPAGNFLTGKTLEVDGGLTYPNLDIPVPDL
jgi:7-alpha-hydroxysteroid dehydrogenase